MAEQLKLKPTAEVPFPEMLFEGYEVFDNYIRANVSVDKIEDIILYRLTTLKKILKKLEDGKNWLTSNRYLYSRLF